MDDKRYSKNEVLCGLRACVGQTSCNDCPFENVEGDCMTELGAAALLYIQAADEEKRGGHTKESVEAALIACTYKGGCPVCPFRGIGGSSCVLELFNSAIPYLEG